MRFFIADDLLQAIVYHENLTVMSNFEEQLGFFAINGVWNIFSIPHKLIPYVYEHICFSHNDSHYMVAGNGHIWYEAPLFSEEIPKIKQPTIVDKILIGPWVSTNATGSSGVFFDGRISELNLFSNPFSRKELMEITHSCKMIERRDYEFKWAAVDTSDIYITPNEKIEAKKVDKSFFCTYFDKKLLAFLPFPRTMETAVTACAAWGGSLFLPIDNKGLELMNRLSKNMGEIVSSLTYNRTVCQDSAWTPLKKNEKDYEKWMDGNKNYKQEVIPKFPIAKEGRQVQTCSMTRPIGAKYFEDYKCEAELCTFCEFSTLLPSFKLRGLCPLSIIESRYVLQAHMDNKEIIDNEFLLLHLSGYTRHAIVYDHTTEDWAIVDDPYKKDYKVLATYKPTTVKSWKTIPKGIGAWFLNDTDCPGLRTLKLSSVSKIGLGKGIFLKILIVLIEIV